MSKITINYNYATDETTIRVDREFTDLPLIHQADALRDALHELEIIYSRTVARTFDLMPKLEIVK